MKSKVLITGGLGYIGSHLVVELYFRGYDVWIIDRADYSAVDRIKKVISQPNVRRIGGRVSFVFCDLSGGGDHSSKLSGIPYCDTVIHLAGLKSVGESVNNPLKYYHNNIGSLISVLKFIEKWTDKPQPLFIFSSSATVYDTSTDSGICAQLSEDHPKMATNPYGETKIICEQILRDCRARDLIRTVIFRYFNPVGAHASGLLGDISKTNIMPILCEAIERKTRFNIFGAYYDTPDGTAIRDYIHISDIVNAHVLAIQLTNHNLDLITGNASNASNASNVPLYLELNLGTGQGVSVKQLIRAMEKATGRHVKARVVAQRTGDAPALCANPDQAYEILGWRSEKTIEDMCRDSWNFYMTTLATVRDNSRRIRRSHGHRTLPQARSSSSPGSLSSLSDLPL
jgi:UDP-glucose 4-epimerase